jgi:ketosteroid isomerase-like protein
MAQVDQREREREMITEAYALWNVGDMATIAEDHWAENVEWHDPPEFEERGIFVGREAVVGRVVEFGVRLGLPKIAGVVVTPVGDQYVAELEMVFRVGAADLSVTPDRGPIPYEAIPYVHVVKLEEGRVVRIMTFSNAAAAFAAAAEEAA